MRTPGRSPGSTNCAAIWTAAGAPKGSKRGRSPRFESIPLSPPDTKKPRLPVRAGRRGGTQGCAVSACRPQYLCPPNDQALSSEFVEAIENPIFFSNPEKRLPPIDSSPAARAREIVLGGKIRPNRDAWFNLIKDLWFVTWMRELRLRYVFRR